MLHVWFASEKIKSDYNKKDLKLFDVKEILN